MTSQAGTAEDRFTEIYKNRTWDGEVLSGPGSLVDVNKRYLDILRKLISGGQVRSVLDIGCGDWTLGRQVDWREVSYLGVDIVKHVVDQNQQRFAQANVSFRCLNVLENDLPDADLVIIKDVLQHLPLNLIKHALKKLAQFPLVLATNDRERFFRYWKWHCIPRHVWHGQPPNSEIEIAGYRPVRLNEAPFNWNAQTLLRYKVPIAHRIHDVKEVLLKRHADIRRSTASK